MAHLHHEPLRVLREIVIGLHHEPLRVYSTLGNYTKTVLTSSGNRSAGVLDLIHTDVCGPMS
jgi:hypothetical protein